ncbi:alpha/beta hydrolase family protein [Paraburkholderia guartelaensis]|uniref:alpha/beta hydrolase family protein n=1 Tax=Paraburkholderia guartelaensis TaxID=2546446 RepID=UPI002AB5E117|nr:CocE/NonD family hydrolase [Paraburkholderia guartelaensis]
MPLRLKFSLSFLRGAFVLLAALPQAAWAADRSAVEPEAPLNEKVVRVPVQTSPLVTLEVTVYMPAHSAGGGPFPLALINHGASHDPMNAPRVGDEFIVWYFLSRGYAVAMPMMRGYAHSWGHLTPHGCDVLAIGNDAAKDIRKVLDYAKEMPGIDATRIVVAGKSMGGWNTLVFGAQNPADVKGLLNFAGGVKEGDCSKPDESLITAAGELGAHTRVPSIWFYGDNDQIFSSATWKGMYAHYTGAGGHAQLVDYGSFQQDAHAMTASGAGLPLWVAKADAFLASIGMPASEVNREYLPHPELKASGYARIKDLNAVPYLSALQKAKLYASYLVAPLPKALAIGSTNGTWASGGFDAARSAMQQCWKISQYCQLYAVDNTVVWPRQESAPPPTNFASLQDVSAVPYLHTDGRQAYTRYLSARRPRAFAIARDGGWGQASGIDSITAALVQCADGHEECRIYSVDGDVVWATK